MNATITTARLAEIYKEVGADISPRDLRDVADGCNENGLIRHRGLDSEGWAYRWAREALNEQQAESKAHAQFCHDAYGDY